ncbi:MAG: TetR family transcriptional regulator C-terminal domain-containing protein [Rhodospirillales bacterium]
MPDPIKVVKKTTAATRPRTQVEINRFRRLALMEGTIESMASHGVAATTVQTITSAAGVSRGLIGHYFDNKEALIAEAFRHLFQEVGVILTAELGRRCGDDAAAQLAAFPEILFSPAVFTPRNRNAFLSFWHEVRFNDLVRRANRELYRDYIDRMTQIVAAAAAAQGLEIDARETALGFIALTDGLWLGLSIHDRLITAAQATDLCRSYLRDRKLLAD